MISLFAIDVDSDDDMDVLVASYTNNSIAWYEDVWGGNPSLGLGISENHFFRHRSGSSPMHLRFLTEIGIHTHIGTRTSMAVPRV